jgi:hypothetical protein
VVRAIVALMMIAAGVAVLFGVVFPWAVTVLPGQEVVLDDPQQ